MNGEAAAGQASVTVDVLKEGWVRVPIPTGLLVRSAQMNGKLVPLSVATSEKGAGQVTALLSHIGRSVLVLNVVVPVTEAATSDTISLPATESGITRAMVQILQSEVDVTVSGGLLTERVEENRQSKWTAYGRGTEALTFTWRRRVPNAHVSVTSAATGAKMDAVSDSSGLWRIWSVPSGVVKVQVDVPGSKTEVRNLMFDSRRSQELNTVLNVGSVSETVEVTGGNLGGPIAQMERDTKKQAQIVQNMPSQNVVNLQRRVAGVLPVAVDVPHSGTAFHFVRPLVVNEETNVRFTYKSK